MSLLECQAIASLEISVFPQQPLPQFVIGDRVTSDCCDGRSGEMIVEFGEIVDQQFRQNSWIYFVNWTHSSASASDSDCYPDCDGEPVPASFLRMA